MRLVSYMLFALSLACSDQAATDAPWLHALQRAHSAADSADSTTTRQQARQELEAALESLALTDPARLSWLKQDLHFRIAHLHLDDGNTTAALFWVRGGLSIDSSPTLSRANLLVLEGKAQERQGNLQGAAEAYHQALLINEALMDAALNVETPAQ